MIWLEQLRALKACPQGFREAGKHATFQELWDNLDRSDWMLWALKKGTNVDADKLAACVAECTVYEHAPLEVKLAEWKRLTDMVRSYFPEPPELE